MVHSLELVFDDRTEAAVRRIWSALADAGIPSQSLAARPHATLAVAARIDPGVDAELAPLRERFPLPCVLGAPLVFGRGAVLARLLVPSAELLAVHAEVYRRALPYLSPGPMDHTEPGRWTGHVTLARRIPPARMAAAVRLAGTPADIVGTVVGLRRWVGERRTEIELW
ncbi:2'-5' RNA ligase family protein [uncultured Mycolicibacterium sp.]|uniref:2'-5' RNA ligase family protein n=1 Tax=uncultured Mycolicibacterium sp. TaxID=2320817 RepID=UPI0026070FDE|nr:2'-5' RNA ligase family protein [uncultured Mycolicibacterium sp.]